MASGGVFGHDGERVHGEACPSCGRADVHYSGNYYCTSCGWSMGEDEQPRRIIIAFLRQCIASTAIHLGASQKVADSRLAARARYRGMLEEQERRQAEEARQAEELLLGQRDRVFERGMVAAAQVPPHLADLMRRASPGPWEVATISDYDHLNGFTDHSYVSAGGEPLDDVDDMRLIVAMHGWLAQVLGMDWAAPSTPQV